MINANDYATREDLENAMHQMYREQLIRRMLTAYVATKSDIDRMSALIGPPFADKCAALDKSAVYLIADCIEEFAKRAALTCLTMKNLCRIIPDELEGEESCE